MAKIGIVGATGYTGLELLRLLIKHPKGELVTLTSETYSGKQVSEVFPSLGGCIDRSLVKLDSKTGEGCDILFLALPHTTAMDKVAGFLENRCRVIDLSADFRIKNPQAFEQWYSTPHVAQELLDEAVYGLPELHREQIKTARLVANPGCYPTGVILALAPLVKSGWANLSSIVADCKSGVSGAGRKASLTTQFAECNEGVSAYNLATHRHTPEMEQEISQLAGQETTISFSPHLMPMTRGLLSTVYVDLQKEINLEELTDCYQKFYQKEPFVRILKSGSYANTHFVIVSNYCDIGLQIDSRNRRAIITSAIDNLVKGASGQAVQNMNIMLGIGEQTAIDSPGIFP